MLAHAPWGETVFDLSVQFLTASIWHRSVVRARASKGASKVPGTFEAFEAPTHKL